MRRYWLIGIFVTSITQAQQSALQQSLNFEDVRAASFYYQNITGAASQTITLAEIRILENNYNEALSILRSNKHYYVTPELEGQFWLLSAVALHKNQLFKQSDEAFNNALKLFNKTDEKIIWLAQYQYWKTLVLLERNRLDESAHAAHAALRFYNQDSTTNYIKKAKLLLWLGGVKKGQDQLDSAKIYLLRSLSLFQNSPLDKNLEIVKVYNNLANVYAKEWSYIKAKDYYEKSIKLNEEKIRNYNELVFACSNFAVFYSDFENQIKAEYWFDQAMQWMKKSPLDPIRLAQLLQNYGSALTKQFEIEKAIDIFKQALQLIEPWKQDREDIYSQILINMATSYALLNQLDKIEPIDNALSQIAEVLKSKWPDQDKRYLLWRIQKSEIEGKFLQALELIYQIEQTFTHSTLTDYKIEVLEYKATCLNNLRRYSESLPVYKQVYQYHLNNKPITHSLVISTLNNIGSVFFYQNQNDSASFYLNQAKTNNLLPLDKVLSEESRFSSKIEWIVSNYYLLQLAKNSYHNGLINFEQLELSDGLVLSTLNILDSKRVELTHEADRMNLARLARDFFDEALDFFFILSQKRPVYINKAFLISEKAKYQALHKAIGLDRLNNFTRVASKILVEEKNLTNKVAQIEYQFAQEIAKNSEPINELLQEYEREWGVTSTRLNYLIDSIKNKLPDYYDLKFNKTTVSITELQHNFLQSNEQIWVSYYMGEATTYAIVITPHQTSFLNLGSSSEIRKQFKALNNFASQFSMNVEEIKTISEKLYAILLKPVKASLSKKENKIKKIVVIPDDVLNSLNFELLIDSAGKPYLSYALYNNQFSYGFSSTLLWMTFGDKAARKLEGAQLLAFAPEFDNEGPVTGTRDGEGDIYNSFGFQALQKNQEEVKQISIIANRKKLRSQIYLGKSADEYMLKKTDLDQFDIIHFATHGFTDAGVNAASGIAFAKNASSKEDDILFMDEIFNLRNNAYLVCLSACETGRGLYKNGEGLLGLTRAFLYSGTRNLVVSLWKVEDESTSSLMKDFYTDLVSTSNISEALHTAKLKVLKRDPNLPPAYWAAFIHIGLD